jgi:methyl-accepting chemotaxis protein
MPKLKDAKDLTAPLEDLVSQLKSELNDSKGDFDRLVQLADEIGAQADGLAETFGEMNETLMDRIKYVRGNTSSSSRRKASSTT